MQSVVNEAMRVDGYCPHVYRPQLPTILYGIDPRKVPSIALERSSKARDRLGRRIRKDAPLMLSGVISVESASSVNFKDFLKYSLRYLRKKYGNNLMSVVPHLDEPHPHLHYYVVPSLENGVFNMAEVHDGIRARSECSGGYSKKANAYKSAMRDFQDSFYNAVGSKLGLTRLGPRVQRLTRKEWKSQQKQAQVFVQQRRDLSRKQQQVAKDEAVLVNKKQAILQQERELTKISKASFFSNKYEMKNEYLRKRLNKLQQHNKDLFEQLEEKQQGLTKVCQDLKSLKQEQSSYHNKFDVMNYKLELKDQFIQQLKRKTGREHEEKYTRNQHHTYQP
ncbi:plasmid recombination protein [Vibrio crassostreae]|uniref:plasmid recombination protein n=1 Tax=Vibrio crassostreae TaxID=246167 RepID=UPI001B309427|nr:plasmid recombination protein [Vibrio crassostreae]